MGSRTAALAGRGRSLSLEQVPVAALAHLARRAEAGRLAAGRHRGIRAHARSRADRLLPGAPLLLGGERLDPVRARVRRPRRGAAGDRLLPGTGPPGRGGLPRLSLRARAPAGGLRLRLELRLLPARLPPTRPADHGVSPARRRVRALSGVMLDCSWAATATPTGRIWRARSSSRATARTRSGPIPWSARLWLATAESSARAGTRPTAPRMRRSTRSRPAGSRTSAKRPCTSPWSPAVTRARRRRARTRSCRPG